jgi:hypothetical protein
MGGGVHDARDRDHLTMWELAGEWQHSAHVWCPAACSRKNRKYKIKQLEAEETCLAVQLRMRSPARWQRSQFSPNDSFH